MLIRIIIVVIVVTLLVGLHIGGAFILFFFLLRFSVERLFFQDLKICHVIQPILMVDISSQQQNDDYIIGGI